MFNIYYIYHLKKKTGFLLSYKICFLSDNYTFFKSTLYERKYICIGIVKQHIQFEGVVILLKFLVSFQMFLY